MNIEIKEELWERFKQQMYVKDYNEPFALQLLGRLANNLLEREINKHDNHKVKDELWERFIQQRRNNEKIF
tara:strand:- start:535 stop:747 length:213 start_codon:yes stop_codon:yes gene_type:complete